MEYIKEMVSFLDRHDGSLMFIITVVYVIATCFICVANIKSAKASKEQLVESQRQFKDSNRPYITCEYMLTNRVFCGIRVCNHGNQVARNLMIKVNEEFLASNTDNVYASFRKINDSVYTVVGIGQSFDFYFCSVENKPLEVPLIVSVTYESATDSFDEVFLIDLAKQLPIESVTSTEEKYINLLKEQNQILMSISQK